jgi:hydrogenase nickel incorporation protein HypB
MCSTCGCGVGEGGATILKPGEFTNTGEFQVMDDHHHHNHTHSHTTTTDKKTIIEVEKEILGHNQLLAERNRGFFEAKKITAINLVSSPGSGKTTLLETTLDDLKDKINFSVIEGDQQTMNDADRIDALNIPVVQINTGKGCHLDSEMVYSDFNRLDLQDNSVLMIENVGNLVCPALFDLGEKFRAVIISTTEGDDKPSKYPDMFEHSQVCIINKIDLLPYVKFDVERVKDFARRINPNLIFFEVSATTGEGMDKWYSWLQDNMV